MNFADDKAKSDVVLDREIALDQLDGDTETLAMLLDLFSTDAPTTMDMIRSAVGANNPAALRSTAHKIKGSLSVLGAPAAMQVALKLETMGRTGNMQDAPATFAALERELARLYPELTQFASELRQSKSKPQKKV